MAGNPQAIQNLMGNRDAIRKIMAMEGKMNQIAESARKDGSLDMSDDGVTYAGQVTQEQYAQQQATTPVVVNEAVMQRHARMPKKILESFQQNPGQDAPLPSGMGGSVLDGLNITPVTPKQTIKESTVSTPVVSQSAMPIDYSLLKTIINEAVQENVKKYVNAMYKKLLEETTKNNVKAIKIGENSFSFITENQDVYQCSPKFKRNLND